MSVARLLVLCLCGALSAIGMTSCASATIHARADVVRSDIGKARKSGAYRCAPRELALAEANVEFAENELAQGNFLRAQEHIEIAVTNANAALAGSRECAPKRVVIKERKDTDGDKIFDDKDACPDAPEDMDGFEDEDGCPDTDNDGDTILDPLDKCPNAAGPADNKGCPWGDADKDGLLDNVDACPDDAGLPEFKGCPRKDGDGDGFFDDEDACPAKAGIAWPDNPKKNGCPPKLSLVEVKDDEIKIKQQVQFDTGKSTIKPASAKLLSEVGLVIRSSPSIKKVIIQGHTDDVGDPAYNLKLSQERAESVRTWLIDKESVDAEILEAKGFGDTMPIASNRTARGRQENRRSEFKVERAIRIQQVVEPDK